MKRVIDNADKFIGRAKAGRYLTPSFHTLATPCADPGKHVRQRSLRRKGWVREDAQPRTIRELFDKSEDLALIGEAGLGKSTQLALLTRELAAEALGDPENRPIPVLLDLADYRSERLEDWLVATVSRKYRVAPARARAWLDEDRLLPVLDGLDAVPGGHREECATQIRRFSGRCTGIVVSCRNADQDKNLVQRIGLACNAELAKPSDDDVRDYLLAHGDALADVRSALDADEDLWPLFRSPLMLDVIRRAYDGAPAPELKGPGSVDDRRRLIFDAYVRRMLLGESGEGDPRRAQRLLVWLTWLSRTMCERGEQSFYLDRVDMMWLKGRGYRLFNIIDGGLLPIIGGLLTIGWLAIANRAGVIQTNLADAGLASMGFVVVIVTMEAFNRNDVPELDHGPTFTVVMGAAALCAVTIASIFFQRVHDWSPGLKLVMLTQLWVAAVCFEGTFHAVTDPVEQIRWSWKPKISVDPRAPFLALTVAPLGLVIGTAVLFGYLFFVLFPEPGWLWPTASGLLVLLLVFGGNVEPSLRDRRVHPNEGIRRSTHFALLIGLANAALAGALLTPLLWLGAPDGLSLRSIMVIGLLAVLFGLLRASRYGGMAAIMHWVTRVVLTLQGNMPLRYQRFLHDAGQRVLLHSEGNGFTFPHRLLQDHLNTSANALLTRLQLDSSSCVVSVPPDSSAVLTPGIQADSAGHPTGAFDPNRLSEFAHKNHSRTVRTSPCPALNRVPNGGYPRS